jgi:hypothetical protein
MSKTICTACPERCILTEKVRDCAQRGDKIWLHRDEVVCRTCPNIEETCYQCTRVGNTEMGKAVQKDDVGKARNWRVTASDLWEDYLSRHPNWKPRRLENYVQ